MARKKVGNPAKALVLRGQRRAENFKKSVDPPRALTPPQLSRAEYQNQRDADLRTSVMAGLTPLPSDKDTDWVSPQDDQSISSKQADYTKKMDDLSAIWAKIGFLENHPNHNCSDRREDEVEKVLREHPRLGPILKSYKLCINERKMYSLLLQFPFREDGEEYRAAYGNKPLELRIKPKNGIVELDIPMNTNLHYNKEEGLKYGQALRNSGLLQKGGSYGVPGGMRIDSEKSKDDRQSVLPEAPPKAKLLQNFDDANNKGHVMNKMTLGGEIIPFSENGPMYMSAAFNGDVCTWTPLGGMVQLSPQFHHIDALRDQEKAEQPKKKKSDKAEKEELDDVFDDEYDDENDDGRGDDQARKGKRKANDESDDEGSDEYDAENDDEHGDDQTRKGKRKANDASDDEVSKEHDDAQDDAQDDEGDAGDDDERSDEQDNEQDDAQDDEDDEEEDEDEDDEDPSKEPKDNKAKAVNMKVKSVDKDEDEDLYGNMKETAKILRSIRDEPWQRLKWIDQDEDESYQVYDECLNYIDPDNAPTLVSEMTSKQYLDAMSCPRVADPKKLAEQWEIDIKGEGCLAGNVPQEEKKEKDRSLFYSTDEDESGESGESEESEIEGSNAKVVQGGRSTVKLPAGIAEPRDRAQRVPIEVLCRIICSKPRKQHKDVEEHLKKKLIGRSTRRFLDPHNRFNRYYRWRLAENKAGRGYPPEHDLPKLDPKARE